MHAVSTRMTTNTAEHEEDLYKKYPSLHDFNLELDRLAERCGNDNEAVVTLAAECEELYNHAQNSQMKPDICSFNTVLKAWSKACAQMSEPGGRQGFHKPVGPNVPVYTPRDAAERVTQLLMDLQKENGDIVPDRTSYNVAIGELCVLFLFPLA